LSRRGKQRGEKGTSRVWDDDEVASDRSAKRQFEKGGKNMNRGHVW